MRSGPSAASNSAGVATSQAADDHDDLLHCREVLCERLARCGCPGGIVGPVEHDERVAPHHLESTRHLDRGERGGDDVGIDRRPQKTLGSGEGRGGVVRLVLAVKRHVHLGELPEWRPQVDDTSSNGEAVGRTTELLAAPPDAPGSYVLGLGLEDRGHDRVLFAEHQQ